MRQWDARDTLPDKHTYKWSFRGSRFEVIQNLQPPQPSSSSKLCPFLAHVSCGRRLNVRSAAGPLSLLAELIGSCNIGAPAFAPALSHRKRFSHWAAFKRPARAAFGSPSGVQRYAVRLGGGGHVPECVSFSSFMTDSPKCSTHSLEPITDLLSRDGC